jgi:hypothetical protein
VFRTPDGWLRGAYFSCDVTTKLGQKSDGIGVLYTLTSCALINCRLKTYRTEKPNRKNNVMYLTCMTYKVNGMEWYPCILLAK